MKKVWGILLTACLLAPVSAEEIKITVNDVKTFLSFAGAYCKEATKIVKNAEVLSIEEIFYLKDESMRAATGKFLKKYGWDFKKMDDFLFAVRSSIDYIMFTTFYGAYPKEQLDKLHQKVSAETILMVNINLKVLSPYFPVDEAYSEFDEDY